MAGFGDFSGYNRPYGLDPNRETNDLYDTRYQQIYGYHTPVTEEFQGPPLVMDDVSEEDNNAYITTAISVASLITENLLSHPFIVLRRQCQVHNGLKNYHIVPYTLLPVVARLHRRQDVTTLWKGIGSTCIVKGLNLAVEDVVSKGTGWPKDIGKCDSVVQFLQHITLKSVSLAIITPFYSASLVETVQSDIASDKPAILDVFREGFMRILEWGTPSRGRMLPIWAIVFPTVSLGITKYIAHITFKKITEKVLRFQQRHRHELSDSYNVNYSKTSNPLIEDISLKANIISFIAMEIIFYPVETIIHRLHIQGTRTIVDNLDTGTSVIPILTGYEGFMDCYNSTIAKEGVSGLYKGFGALVLQLAAHLAIIKLTTLVVSEVSNLLKPAKSPTSDDSIPSQKYLFN
ncbi:solute carrier family 25 member 46-like [Spodoptera litura]|uniref:Solute carrier family 25 member 46-like n=1 Tax=Spodoptera litura TaxID=69820 RepID=A0A9J7E973_SPOLT|nr:solute carrier family 25 member 46-like [Spodoptera litura]XP_022824497.1 solute carrier family 25 member 46-like [Spodoptera litura]